MNTKGQDKLKPMSKMTLSDICHHFGFYSRNPPNTRPDLKHLFKSLQHKKAFLIKKYGFDIDKPPLRSKLSYPLTVDIYKILQP